GGARRMSSDIAIRCASIHRQHIRAAAVHDLRPRRLGRHDRRLCRCLCDEPDHCHRRLLLQHRIVLCLRLYVLHRSDVCAAERSIFPVTAQHAMIAGLAVVLVALSHFVAPYFMDLLIQILLWGFVYTSWSIMGRFGFVSLGHGAFMGVGAYVPALLWNYAGLTPWIGIPIGVGFAVLLGLLVGYPCFRLKVVGHYFALVTLAFSQVVMLSIVAARDVTAGSLGFTPQAAGHSWSPVQFCGEGHLDAISLGLWVGRAAAWYWIDRGDGREALDAIAVGEEAAASTGINVIRDKLRVAPRRAALAELGGALFRQYMVCL